MASAFSSASRSRAPLGDRPWTSRRDVPSRRREACAFLLDVRSPFCSIKITEDVRKYAAEQSVSADEAFKKGMEEKSKEFVKQGVEVYSKA